MASDDNGHSIMGTYAPGDSKWFEQDGFTGADFTDFYMFNVLQDSEDMYLLYIINGTDLYMVTQSAYDPSWWYNNELIYSDSNGIRLPQAQTHYFGATYVTVQSVVDGSITLLFRPWNETGAFANWGVPTFPDDSPIQAVQGLYSMFLGTVDQGGGKTLWIYFMDPVTAQLYVTWASNPHPNAVQLSEPELVEGLPLYNTTSLSTIGKDDTYTGLLFRTGYMEEDDLTPCTVYTVIKLNRGPVSELCAEQIVKWGPSNSDRVVSNFAPALTSSALATDEITLTWVDWQDGTLNTLAGNPW